MHPQANAKPFVGRFHAGRQKAFDDDHGNDDFSHRGAHLFGHHPMWHDDGHQHHRGSTNSAEDPGDGMTALIGGSAVAAGEASAVAGWIENFAADRGNYSIAMGEATFQVSAHSDDAGGALAAASTFLDVSGADFIFEHAVGQSALGSNDAWARSELDYLSIDIHGWSPRQGPLVIEMDQAVAYHPPGGQEPLQGNFAQVFAMADVHGVNALSATLTTALAVENQFSFVHAVGMVTL